ncbi:MAG: hypothetical protein MJ101_02570 [Clostridia bacterium]|nr:hypothetical protein [Clostridia bacterium]
MNIERFLSSFEYMGIGMLGIFAVMGIIMVSVAVIGRLSRNKSDAAENKDE